MKIYWRVEAYAGCGMTLSGIFSNEHDARRHAASLQAADARVETRVVKVDRNGAAL
jgi:hypothetical protein